MVSESDFKRTYWASRRGMLELDLILLPFVEHRYRELGEADRQHYHKLLQADDTRLFAWFLGRERPADPDMTGIVDAILAFAGPAED